MVGFLQYIGPTLMLALGVLLFKESFDHMQLFAFMFIWLALIIFTISHIYSAAKIKQLANAAQKINVSQSPLSGINSSIKREIYSSKNELGGFFHENWYHWCYGPSWFENFRRSKKIVVTK